MALKPVAEFVDEFLFCLDRSGCPACRHQTVHRKPKQSKPGQKTTPSFVCEVPLRVTLPQEQTLQIRFEVARQLYNALLGEVLRRMRLYRQSQAYQGP